MIFSAFMDCFSFSEVLELLQCARKESERDWLLLLVTFLIPVSAIILGVTVLGETLQTRHLFGMVLIGCGLAAIDGRAWRAFRRLTGK